MTLHMDRSFRLPESEYFAQPQAKSGIAIHHTVGGSARSTPRIRLGSAIGLIGAAGIGVVIGMSIP